ASASRPSLLPAVSVCQHCTLLRIPTMLYTAALMHSPLPAPIYISTCCLCKPTSQLPVAPSVSPRVPVCQVPCHVKVPAASILFYCLRIHESLAFVRKSSDVGFFTLDRHLDNVPEGDAHFHSCKVICGLQCLHAMRTVHMDLKPENIPLPDSGHVLIAEVDRSYDVREEKTSRNTRLLYNSPIFGTQNS
ncbi:G protein-coupled receptor kinase 6, partial [Taenia solium]